jgi:hypothetical protein
MTDARDGARKATEMSQVRRSVVARKCSRRNVMVFDRSVFNGLVNGQRYCTSLASFSTPLCSMNVNGKATA